MTTKNSVAMSLEEYQAYMDALTMDVSKAMGGARLEDAITACAACIGFGMAQLPPEHRETMRTQFNNIIDKIIERSAATPGIQQ
jgi:hypothetical protein